MRAHYFYTYKQNPEAGMSAIFAAATAPLPKTEFIPPGADEEKAGLERKIQMFGPLCSACHKHEVECLCVDDEENESAEGHNNISQLNLDPTTSLHDRVLNLINNSQPAKALHYLSDALENMDDMNAAHILKLAAKSHDLLNINRFFDWADDLAQLVSDWGVSLTEKEEKPSTEKKAEPAAPALHLRIL